MEQKIEHTTIIKVVRKLIGPINPIGETNADNDRLENLKEMCILVNKLVSDIHDVYIENKSKPEFSMKRASEVAHDFLEEVICIPT